MLKRNRLYGLILTLSVAAGALLLYTGLSAGQGSEVIICPFKLLTGMPCPSCGTARAVLLITEGDLFTSVMMNPLGIPAAIALLVTPAWVAADLLRNSDSLFRAFRETERFISSHKWAAFLLAALISANWIWNFTKGL
ncbi:DUF2752 domain-containing protein [Balneolales bacterium ANBcel1]|nr:DUF2752 domain-containing protein [Balneolales bacterium ANBcel1]